MRCLNFYRLWSQFAKSTIVQGLCQGASSSSVTYQCVLLCRNRSCADKSMVCSANNKIGCFYWDDNRFVGVKAIVSLLNQRFRTQYA
jgi:hypothetical protein